jgi:putative hydrolase
VTPVEALELVVHYLDRSFENGFKTKAYARALEVVRGLNPGELEARAATGTLTELEGIGDSIARLLADVVDTGASPLLDRLDQETRLKLSPAARVYRDALRGDCHLHTRWSDGAASAERMASAAAALGHEYIVVTDHSGRLTVAHGLDRDRLVAQLAELDQVRERVAPFRVLSGMEVDIFEDGTLDLDDDLPAQLDVVVASVHSKLRQDTSAMTRRMVTAAANPHVDILGHCTGRMIGKRPPSTFDPDSVFGACAEFRTAVEINCRPERLDPPDELLDVALQHGCLFAIDSDAHATGQLEWLPHGCEIAARNNIPLERILNTRSADGLLEWVASRDLSGGGGTSSGRK